MAKCKISIDGRTFRKSVKKLQKKFRSIAKDIDDHRLKIEADYKSVCNAFCVPMPNHPDLQNRIWKYDIGSTDLKKHPRHCFRLIGILDDASKQDPEMSAVIIFHKGDQENITPKQIKTLYDSLTDDLDEDEEDEAAAYDI